MAINEISESQAKWLAGAFEAGGSFYFGLVKRIKGGVYLDSSYPALSITDNNLGKMTALRDSLSGSLRSHSQAISYSWLTRGQPAIIYSLGMEPFAPSRQSDIAIFQSWDGTVNKEKQFIIARSFKQRSPRLYVPSVQYHDLVQMPEFVAGVIDCRGYIHTVIRNPSSIEYRYPQLRIVTANRPLVEALKNKYGGGIYLHTAAGSVRTIDGREVTGRQNTVDLAINSSDLKNLLPNIRPYLVIGKINNE